MVPNKKLLAELLGIFSLPILILIIHIPFEVYDVYNLIWWIDIPMHFLGGLLIGRSYFLLIGLLQREDHMGNMHRFAHFVFVVSLVALTAVAWETQEFILDLTDNAMRQPGLANTMQDLILGILGGTIGFAIQFFILENNQHG